MLLRQSFYMFFAVALLPHKHIHTRALMSIKNKSPRSLICKSESLHLLAYRQNLRALLHNFEPVISALAYIKIDI